MWSPESSHRLDQGLLSWCWKLLFPGLSIHWWTAYRYLRLYCDRWYGAPRYFRFVRSFHLYLNVLFNAFQLILPLLRLVGWKDAACGLRESANFWHRIWSDSGCPSSGVLFQIKKNAKSRYKYEVRRLKRSQRTLLQTKIAFSFAKGSAKPFTFL